MSEAAAFDYVCTQLEERTTLNRLEARGTVRLALKAAGLDASSVSPDQMAVVLDRVLPGELASRGIEGGEGLCTSLQGGLRGLDAGPGAETPEAVFQRLAGGP
jgi:hypothetical protein